MCQPKLRSHLQLPEQPQCSFYCHGCLVVLGPAAGLQSLRYGLAPPVLLGVDPSRLASRTPITSSCDFHSPGRSSGSLYRSDQTRDTIAHQTLAKAREGEVSSHGGARGEGAGKSLPRRRQCWKWTTLAVTEHCSLSGQTLPPHPCPLPRHSCLHVLVRLHVGCGFCLCHFGRHPLWVWADITGADERTALLSIFCWEIVLTL